MYKKLRWKRIEKLEIDFNYIKAMVKMEFDYEVREGCLKDFLSNIHNYKNIAEGKLLFILEKDTYKKLSVFHMKDIGRDKTNKIYEELTNDAFLQLFKERNRINYIGDNEYTGELDNVYKIVNYAEGERYIQIKLARLYDVNIDNNVNRGITTSGIIQIYECCKFIVDLESKWVFMMYNDPTETNINAKKEYTGKKRAFYELFTGVNQNTINNLVISDNLNKYFLEYMSEVENNDIKKSISVIEASTILVGSKATKSTANNYNHDRDTIDVIKKNVQEKGYHISLLEFMMNSNLMRIKNTSEVSVPNAFLSREVLKGVCEQFFDDNQIYRLCTM